MQTVLVILIVAACVAALGWRLWKYFRRGATVDCDCGCGAGSDCPANRTQGKDGAGIPVGPCDDCPLGEMCHSPQKKEA